MDTLPNLARKPAGDRAAVPLIAAHGLGFQVRSQAGEINILRGVDLTVGAGEAVGIIGPSGSGKTSLLMLLAGLDRPTTGTLSVAGHDLARMGEDALARFRREHVGIVFQAFHLVPTMTAIENVAVPLEFSGRADAFDRAEEVLKSVGLGHRLTHYPGQLSGGEQQRVALARAFVAEPQLLLADEPTGNLDRGTGGHVMDLLFGLRERFGTTLLLITHDPLLAERCERQVRIEDGRIVADGPR
ncbi:ABC transporter ATP-binding protein [Neoroseomonas oryzicola]|uniref:ABC transporter ATP-binding protein n=1 Tax=Neoroseomonas oryzicola TaxID=535904 RepID=A0A9X9WI27_9PROT|nr:ABC transporter ATP-binding protein [Neoroseomonas oryzicola]MBR0659987.1 ABC transporter ATP-binding protein [Neoroseomonas oryzicola]NKE19461.1 ABC transporter ATP-binding protein [Neoroseomonas oryzicola]